MRYPNSGQGCPWKMKVIMSKKIDKWTITKWGRLTHMYESYKKDDSYDLLPRWLERMVQCCSGSTHKLETNDIVLNNQVDNHFRKFQRVFWSFKLACAAFQYCKPIIQIDVLWNVVNCHNTNGNSCVLPIAFAIVEGEMLNAWSLFLVNIQFHQGICLISKYHASIKLAVRNAYPGWQPPKAYHVYCIHHIASNFNHQFKNTKLKEELINLGNLNYFLFFIHLLKFVILFLKFVATYKTCKHHFDD
ncbi:hypothetical protein CR513_28182, partial [Mucuna pruriens]